MAPGLNTLKPGAYVESKRGLGCRAALRVTALRDDRRFSHHSCSASQTERGEAQQTGAFLIAERGDAEDLGALTIPERGETEEPGAPAAPNGHEGEQPRAPALP